MLSILNSNLMLNLYLLDQSLSVFTNIYGEPIAILGHMCRSLHHIASYSKGCMPYQGICILHCVSTKENMYFPEKV